MTHQELHYHIQQIDRYDSMIMEFETDIWFTINYPHGSDTLARVS